MLGYDSTVWLVAHRLADCQVGLELIILPKAAVIACVKIWQSYTTPNLSLNI